MNFLNMNSNLKSKMKAQASMEYLLVLSIAALLVVPTFYLFFTQTQKTSDYAISQQVLQMGTQITSGVDSVYGYGKDAKFSVKLNMPANVQRVYLKKDATNDPQYPAKELVFEILSEGKTNTLVFFSSIPISVSEGPSCHSSLTDTFPDRFLSPGEKRLELISCGKNVTIHLS